MVRPRSLAPALLALLLARAGSASATTADPPAPSRPDSLSHAQRVIQAYHEAGAAREAGRFQHYLQATDRALALEPGHPVLMLHMARACARTGDLDAAEGWLARVAATGIQADLDADAELAPLRARPGFAAARDEMSRQAAPQGAAEVAFRLGEPDFLPEGIACDPLTEEFFVGSLRLGKIARVDAAGGVSDFVPAGSGALWSPLGMKVDVPRRLLWVCDTAGPYMVGGTPADTARTTLAAFRLDDGSPVARVALTDTSRARGLNDCALGPDGSVYATDAAGGGVWMLRPGSSVLEALLPDGSLAAPNGIDISADGGLLYVAEYGLGIALVDLETLAIERLQAPEEFCTAYVDGLNRHEHTLVVVQNGRGLDRVVRLFLDETGRRVEGMAVLAARLPEFDEPTTGCVAGGAYYFVANSQLRRLGRDGALSPADPPRDFLIMRAALR